MLAGLSDAGSYVNDFRTKEGSTGNPGILKSVLAELWDFDSRISTGVMEKRGVRMRGYYQSHAPSSPVEFQASLPGVRWQNYCQAIADNPNREDRTVPPLPPGPYNHTHVVDKANPTDPNDPNSPTIPAVDYTHHLIREFMLLDAAANNQVNDIPQLPDALPDRQYPYQLARIPLNTTEDDVALYTNGPGHYQEKKYLLVDTFDRNNGSLDFESRNVGFTALLYELQDGNKRRVDDSPNWFGVAVPDGITDFRNVIIYFHPSTGQSGAGYSPDDYREKTGANGTNWKELYAYVERLGKQLAGAVEFSTPDVNLANQILIFPIMKAGPGRLFPKYWYNIVMDILDDLYTKGVGV